MWLVIHNTPLVNKIPHSLRQIDYNTCLAFNTIWLIVINHFCPPQKSRFAELGWRTPSALDPHGLFSSRASKRSPVASPRRRPRRFPYGTRENVVRLTFGLFIITRKNTNIQVQVFRKIMPFLIKGFCFICWYKGARKTKQNCYIPPSQQRAAKHIRASRSFGMIPHRYESFLSSSVFKLVAPPRQ